ncbi:MAG TPA: glycosyl hydrolase [Chitinophagaceae bacterium]|nr:glycosyl hydrolase [Chitinophagaceae bacterium]
MGKLMFQQFYYLFLIAIAGISFSCKKNDHVPVAVLPPTVPVVDTVPGLATVRSWLVDKAATEQTAALFYNLKRVAKTTILFGHQDATKRGVANAGTQWANEQQFTGVAKDRSDVKEVTGVYPAIYGHDFLHIANFTDGPWFDYETRIAKELTIEAYNRGGVNTYAWHYSNPVSKGSFYWDQSPVEAVSKILPGGSSHAVYKASLKEIGDFARSLLGADGKLVPVIFRPFHEFDGDWFWWGKAHTTAADYKTLYQFTVTYLRDSLGVHNFLYAWSPDKNFTSEAQYLERYPGDDFVDVVGTDNYGDLSDGSVAVTASNKLKIVSDYGKAKNKVAALTETGSTSNLAKTDWFTSVLLNVLTYQKLELAYALVWANTKTNFYTPYKGHPSEADFIKFKNNSYLVFSDKLPNMYGLK